jgi:hypothetical protein
LYFPPTRYAFTEIERETVYDDAAGQPRTVRVLLRVPTAAPRPLPVVVWSHGGAHGKSDPANSMQEWSVVKTRGRGPAPAGRRNGVSSVLDVLVNWAMKNAILADAPAGLSVFERFSSPG